MVRPLQKSKSINLLETYLAMLYKDLRKASDTRAKELISMRKPNAVCLDGASLSIGGRLRLPHYFNFQCSSLQ